MGLILKDGSIFLHVPKTGGSFVSHVLKRQRLVRKVFDNQHTDISRLDRRYNSYNRYVFTFVRDPLDWYESWFRYHTYNKDRVDYGSYKLQKWHPNMMLRGCVVDDFNQTVENIYKLRPGYVTEMYGWYTDPNVVDFVGNTNNLYDDLVWVLRDLGINFSEMYIRYTRPKRVSKGPPVEWDDDLRQKVFKSEYASYEKYGIETPSDLSIN